MKTRSTTTGHPLRAQRRKTGYAMGLPILSALVSLAFSAETTADTLKVDQTTFAPFQNATRECHDCRIDLAPPEGTNRFDRIDVLFAYRGPSDFNRFTWNADGWRLAQTRGGARSQIADDNAAIPDAFRKGGRLIIKSRTRTIEVVAASQRVLRTLAHGTSTGVVAIASGASQASVTSSRIQGVEPVVFGDDFSRAEDEIEAFGVWEPIRGDWRFHSVAKDIEEKPELRKRTIKPGIVERIANPFSLSGSASATNDALLITGYSFWNDYTAAVSAKSSGAAVGLAFGIRDATNLWYLRWGISTRRITPARLELVHRSEGTDRVVDSAWVAARTHNWYRLAVRTIGPSIEVRIDERPILSTRSDQSIGGAVGLMAFGSGTVHYDDVNVDSASFLSLHPDGMPPPFDETLSGTWSAAGPGGARAFVAGKAGHHTPAVRLLGSPSWTPTSFEARLGKPETGHAAGLLFAATSKTDYWRLLWRAERGGRLVLSQLQSGHEVYRKTVPVAIGATDEIRLRVERTDDALLRCSVDGSMELLADPVRELTGHVGLYADSSEYIRFSDVRLDVPDVRDWERPVKVGEFADDPYMQGWASPRRAWLPVGTNATTGVRLYRHKGDFYGDLSVHGPLTDGLSVRFGSDDVAADTGYRVAFTFKGNSNETEVALYRAGVQVAHTLFRHVPRQVIAGEQVVDEKIGPLPLPSATVSYGDWEIGRDGKYIRIEAGGELVIAYRDHTPLTGRELTLATREPLDVGRIGVKRDRVKDYHFERAGVAWSKVGTWEVTNRFSCDPRWSHMNGRSHGLAALWSKLEFTGDYTVEYYAGMRMRQGDMLDSPPLYYPRVGDINVALCADGSDVFSGYNLIIAAWDRWWSERWTRFMREDRTLVETDRELIPRTRDSKPRERAVDVDWDPGGRPVHGAWYYVKIRKTGNRYDVWFDNVPVFSCEDPAPLTGKRLALWTQDNSIVLARVCIGYRDTPRVVPSECEPADEAAAKSSQVASDADTAAHSSSSIRCPSHHGRHFDFETGLDGWQSADDDQGARIERMDGEGKRGRYFLRLSNRYAGGDFKTIVPLPSVDLDRVDNIAFDCAVPVDVRVHLYLRLKGHRGELCYIALSGPDEEVQNLVRLGSFEGFKANGKWRGVHFSLAEALHRRFPDRKRFILEEMCLAYLHGGYLNAGLGGNAAGAHYDIDNFTVLASGPATATVLREDDSAVAASLYTITGVPEIGDEVLIPLPTNAVNTIDLPEAGLHFLGIFAKSNGVPRRLVSIPIRTDKSLRVKSTTPRPQGKWGGGPILVQFATDTSASLLPTGLSLRVNDYNLPSAALGQCYDREHKQLTIDPTGSKLEVGDGNEVQFTLTYKDTVTDPSTNAPPRVFTWTATMDYAKDETAPNAVELDLPGSIDMSFDGPRTRTKPYTTKTRVRLETTARENSRENCALNIINNVCGSSFGVDLGVRPFNAGRLPLLLFDYRVIPQARIDLFATTSDKNYVIGLNDVSADEEGKDGAVPDACADGEWHHAEVDLASVLTVSQDEFSPRSYDVRQLVFRDGGYMASPAGAWYAIDNIRTVPVISSHAGESFAWRAQDVSGIAGYSYAWTREPDTSVDKTPETETGSAVFTNLPEGEMYFHVRARDGAGNWGPTSHHRILVDNSSPTITPIAPSPGAATATSTVSVAFGDSLAKLDLSDARMTINGDDCRLRSDYASFSPEQRRLTWQWVNGTRRMRAPIPDGQTMTARLAGLKDFAGNVSSPVEWKWRIDYASDRRGPAAPELTCWSQHTERFDDFSDGTGNWRVYDAEDECTEMNCVVDPDTGDTCLRLTKTGNRTYFAAYAFRGQLNTNDYDLIAFDYKMPAGAALNLRIYVGSEWRMLTLTAPDGNPSLGRVEGIQADGRWHHARIDLPRILRDAMPDGDGKDYTVRYIMFGSWQRNGNPVGTSVYIDNFAILKSGPPLPELSCTSVDATGIRGHIYAMDRDPRTEPSPASTANLSRMLFPAIDTPGMWYIHARAQDGAGNWGATRHYPYYCVAPLPSLAGRASPTPVEWNACPTLARTQCDLAQHRSFSGERAYQVLSLRTWRADTVRLHQANTNAVPSDWTLTLFNQGRTALQVAPYACVKGEDTATVGLPLELPAGKWITDVRLALEPPHEEDGQTAVSYTESGLIFTAPDRARSQVIIADIREGGGS